MIIDSSVLVAILQKEKETQVFLRLIASAPVCEISAASLLEASMVIFARYGDAGVADLDKIIALYKIMIVPFTSEQAFLARLAFQRYGKGYHAAGLNFGDCISYALSMDKRQPLLFKGFDFSKTDVELVDIKQ